MLCVATHTHAMGWKHTHVMCSKCTLAWPFCYVCVANTNTPYVVNAPYLYVGNTPVPHVLESTSHTVMCVHVWRVRESIFMKRKNTGIIKKHPYPFKRTNYKLWHLRHFVSINDC